MHPPLAHLTDPQLAILLSFGLLAVWFLAGVYRRL